MKEFMTPLHSTLETPISVALTVLVLWILKNLIRDIVKATGLKELEFTKGGLKAKFDPAQFSKEAYDKQGMGEPSPEDVKEVGTLVNSFSPFLVGRRLMWIDDHPENNLLERTALVKWGVSVQTRRTTDEAMTELRDNKNSPFDLVISDWYRDGQPEGRRLAKRLRENVPSIRVPIIYYFRKNTVTDFQGVNSKVRELGAIGATSSPRELLRWTFAELVRASLLDEKIELVA